MAFTRPKASQINFDTTNITDPLIRLNSAETGSADKDVGIVIERGDDTNVAIIYDESANEFAVINTTETGTTSGNVTIASYADIRAGAATFAGTLSAGATTVTTLSASGAIATTMSNPYLLLKDTGGSGNATIYAQDSVGVNVGSLQYNHSVDAWVLIGGGGTILTTDSSQNATFAGDVNIFGAGGGFSTSSSGLYIDSADQGESVVDNAGGANAYSRINFSEAGTKKWRIEYDGVSNHLELTENGVAAHLTIADTTGNATFAGNVGVNGGTGENALDISLANGDGIRLGQIDAAHGGSLTRFVGLNDLGGAGSFAGGCAMAFDAVNTNDYEIYWQTQNFGVGNPKMTFTHDGNLVLDTGGATFAGAIAMGTNKITGMGDPTSAQDAATKAYVDSQSSGGGGGGVSTGKSIAMTILFG